MNFTAWIEKLSSLDFWLALFSSYRDLGFWAPIALAALESIIPALPLIAIVSLNVTTFGLFWGYLFSWLGSFGGSVLVFLFFRTIILEKVLPLFIKKEHPRLLQIQHWVAKQSTGAIIVLSAIPFTPSSWMNMGFGLSGYSKRRYLGAVFVGKAVSVLLFALFGSSLLQLSERPWLVALAFVVLLGLYLLSRWLTKRSGIQKAQEKDDHP